VNGRDFQLWKHSFGDAQGIHFGDADSDLDVDGGDFLTWQRDFGFPGQLAADQAVPEPPALALLVSAAAASYFRRRNALSAVGRASP
jgi:hypothetical protein